MLVTRHDQCGLSDHAFQVCADITLPLNLNLEFALKNYPIKSLYVNSYYANLSSAPTQVAEKDRRRRGFELKR